MTRFLNPTAATDEAPREEREGEETPVERIERGRVHSDKDLVVLW